CTLSARRRQARLGRRASGDNQWKKLNAYESWIFMGCGSDFRLTTRWPRLSMLDLPASGRCHGGRVISASTFEVYAPVDIRPLTASPTRA
ncbi:MAG TPA: hypothetical protein VGC79_15080, partial [Polyangiaceae bacterium]